MRLGIRCQVVPCSGCDSNRIGVVVPRSRLSYNEHGVPLLSGYYKPLSKEEVVLEDENGDLFTMYKHRLREL